MPTKARRVKRLPPRGGSSLPSASAPHKKSRPCGAALQTLDEVLSLNQDLALDISTLTAG